MKVVVTGTRGIPNILGGVETHSEELYPRVVKNAPDIDVTVIRRAGYPVDSLSEFKGVHLCDISMPQKKSLEAIIHTFKAVWTAKFRLKADILHIHAVGPAILVPFAKLLGLKVVFTHHGPDYDRDKWGKVAKFMLRFGERMGCMFADEVIVISEVINDLIKRKYNRQDAHLIYNGVAVPTKMTDQEYLFSLGIQTGKYIFAMGRFVPEKNFDQLIRAFASLNHKDYKLVLAGDNLFHEQYSNDLKDLAIKNNIVLTGFIKDEKLYTLLTNARAFVLPSSHEGLPIALLEAMSYDLPVIVSDIPANKEIHLPEECYFRCGDEKQLAQKIIDLINSDQSRCRYDMQCYDWDKISGQVISLYRTLYKK